MHHLEPLLLLLLPGAMVTTPDAPVMVVAVHIYCFSLFVNNHSSQYSPNEKKKRGARAQDAFASWVPCHFLQSQVTSLSLVSVKT